MPTGIEELACAKATAAACAGLGPLGLLVGPLAYVVIKAATSDDRRRDCDD